MEKSKGGKRGHGEVLWELPFLLRGVNLGD
jgi:hypothetical protein